MGKFSVTPVIIITIRERQIQTFESIGVDNFFSSAPTGNSLNVFLPTENTRHLYLEINNKIISLLI